MIKFSIIFFSFLIFFPALVLGSVSGDFQVNSQPTYSVPPGTTNVLILDLTIPQGQQIKSIKINNAGSAQQYDISKLTIFEDGASPGWDGDEIAVASKISSPFWDTYISGNFSAGQQRIFVTIDIASTAASEKVIKPELVASEGEAAAVQFVSGESGPTDENIIGLERMILAGASHPTIPVPPLAKTGEALSTTTIRWHFLDLSNNEFGFKILDSNLNEVAKNEEANLSYLDETGLQPNTEYFGRRAYTFNDRGESQASLNFSAVFTLSLPPVVEEVEEVLSPEEVVLPEEEEAVGGSFSIEELRAKITELQLKIIELIQQYIQLLQEQLVKVASFLAGLWITIF